MRKSALRLTAVLTALLFLFGTAGAVTALPLQLYAAEHFAFAIPQDWTESELDGMICFIPEDDSLYPGAILTVEEMDMSGYAPFTAEALYQGIAAGLSDTEEPVCEAILIDGHSAALVELTSEGGCLCTVLYCRGVSLLAISVTSPERDTDAARSLLLNTVRYISYLGT